MLIFKEGEGSWFSPLCSVWGTFWGDGVMAFEKFVKANKNGWSKS
jgi:hypothetical protein